MYGLLFAGGFGKRLWPISRKNKPKQFSAMFGTKSFLQLAVDRLLPIIPSCNIFISTNENFASTVIQQLPHISEKNLILEPEKRDLAAATGLAFFKLESMGITGPIYFQWADNYVKNEEGLRHAITVGRELINHHPGKIIFIGQTPRFPSENLGWIEHGKEIGRIGDIPYYEFQSWHYRPKPEVCVKMFKSNSYVWNSGYFLTTMEFVTSTFRQAAPDIVKIAEEIISYKGMSEGSQELRELYRKMPILHFDEAFLMRLRPEQALLLKIDLDWTDPGTLCGLKEALQTDQKENVKHGAVVEVENSDCMFYNEDQGKVLSAMGLNGVIVVNTPETILVIGQDSVRHMTKLLNEIENRYEDIL